MVDVRPTRLLLTIPALLALTGLATAQTAAPRAAASSAIAKAPPSFDLNAMDRGANPCDNFYKYSCGMWLAHNPIPADRARWGRFDELRERNTEVLRGILERASNPSATRDADTQKIGDLYASCMDEKAVNARGDDPIKPELARIDSIADKHEVVTIVPRLHRQGVDVLFRFGSSPDPKNSKMEIGDLDQGGLGLPDRDYYLRTDPKSVEVRKAYVTHIQNMLHLIGEAPATAASDAQAVMAFETALAKGSLDNVSRRDPNQVFHKLSIQELTSLCPFFSWPAYFDSVGSPKIDSLNVDVPNFMRALETALVETDLPVLKAYLRWHLVHAEAALLSQPFVDEDFSFYGHTLQGTAQLRPRWKRCVDLADGDLGFALGKKYVDETFGAEGKARTLKMVHDIENAMHSDLQSLSWMTPETKKYALEKLAAVANKIGYPDHWRDYSSVDIVRGDLVGDDLRATEFEVERQIHKIGKPVDRSEWGMTPPTVNAYYNPLENNINFPAGILQPPFYSNQVDDAVNYGAIGAVIGHELTHGFDDQGRQFDADGNLQDWWTKEDAAAFEKRAQCFVDEYSKFIASGDVHENGKLELGENTADNGGLRLAFMALMSTLEGHEPGKRDGFTPEQRFFLGWGQIWCENIRPEAARNSALTNPHALGEFRVNGVLSNMPEFEKAFSCKQGDPMVRVPQCRVW